VAGRSHKDSQVRLASVTRIRDSYERTDERTYVDVNPDCDIVQLSDVHARVHANDSEWTNLAAETGYRSPGMGERFPVLRTGERDPIAPDLRVAIYRRDGMRCVDCGSTWDFGGRLELDHIVPWSAGGSDAATNLRTLCHWCNDRRSNKHTGADGRRYLPVTWWCIDCHGLEESYVHRPERVRSAPPRMEPRRGLTFAYCATCDINGYTEVVL
jgi:hypothetical protein